MSGRTATAGSDSFSRDVVEHCLKSTGGYQDLSAPVILTSGELGIYYVNTEKTAEDKGAWEKYADNSRAMIDHAIRCAFNRGGHFGKLIDVVADKVGRLIGKDSIDQVVISGGQRRDWLFSGPVAARLGLPHVSLFKQESSADRMDYIFPHGEVAEIQPSIEDHRAIHVVDLITEGSSVYREEQGRPRGWIPMLRERGAHITDLIAIVSRGQGGEEKLAAQGVNVHSFVTIDADFLRRNSSNPDRALDYQRDPRAWSESYLRTHGALQFVNTFDPKVGKTERAKKFLERYGGLLKDVGKYDEFAHSVMVSYDTDITSWARNRRTI